MARVRYLKPIHFKIDPFSFLPRFKPWLEKTPYFLFSKDQIGNQCLTLCIVEKPVQLTTAFTTAYFKNLFFSSTENSDPYVAFKREDINLI